MKLLKGLLEDANHLLFLDFEGTQYTHEVIAVGAVLVDCDSNYVPISEPSTFKCYVKTKAQIGSVVVTMTGITDSLLNEQGIEFSQCLTDLNNFLGNRSSKLKVLTYGDQDKRMLTNSFKILNSPTPFQKDFVNYLCRNTVDLGAFISKYLRGKKSEYISLIHLREFLKIEPSGNSHDPLVDAMDLYHIFQVLVSKKELLVESYKNLLKTSNLLPPPVKKLIMDLDNDQTLTKEDLLRVLEGYFA